MGGIEGRFDGVSFGPEISPTFAPPKYNYSLPRPKIRIVLIQLCQTVYPACQGSDPLPPTQKVETSFLQFQALPMLVPCCSCKSRGGPSLIDRDLDR